MRHCNSHMVRAFCFSAFTEEFERVIWEMGFHEVSCCQITVKWWQWFIEISFKKWRRRFVFFSQPQLPAVRSLCQVKNFISPQARLSSNSVERGPEQFWPVLPPTWMSLARKSLLSIHNDNHIHGTIGGCLRGRGEKNKGNHTHVRGYQCPESHDIFIVKRGHFTTSYPLKEHPRGHFITLNLPSKRVLSQCLKALLHPPAHQCQAPSTEEETDEHYEDYDYEGI